MRIIVTYDVSVTSDSGKKRLCKIAKICKNYGLRVQNSVFECEVPWDKLIELRQALLKAINTETDSLRIYFLGNDWNGKIEHYGTKKIVNLKDDTLLF